MTDKEKLDKEKSDNEKSNKEIRKQRKPGDKKPGLLDFYVGKGVKIQIRGGKIIEGKLEKMAQYELLLTVNEAPLLIMKHSIDTVELTWSE